MVKQQQARMSEMHARSPFAGVALVFSVLALLPAGCAGRDGDDTLEAAREPAPAPRNAAASEPTAAEPAGAEPASLPEPVVARLVTGIDSLTLRTPDPRPATVAEALRALAAALELVPAAHGPVPPARTVRKAADRLAKDADDAPARATRTALEAVLRAVGDARVPAGRADELRAAVNALAAALAEIDGGETLRSEALPVTRALRAAGDAVLLVGGTAPRFATAEPSLPPGSPAALSTCVSDLRRKVGELAAARYPDERSRAVRALDAIGDCLAVAPGKSKAVERRVSQIRFEVARLGAADSFEPRDAAWIQRGLSAALAALEELAAGLAGRGDLARWIAPARKATAAIDERTGLAFQRARIQDAFRAVADAVAAASLEIGGDGT